MSLHHVIKPAILSGKKRQGFGFKNQIPKRSRQRTSTWHLELISDKKPPREAKSLRGKKKDWQRKQGGTLIE